MKVDCQCRSCRDEPKWLRRGQLFTDDLLGKLRSYRSEPSVEPWVVPLPKEEQRLLKAYLTSTGIELRPHMREKVRLP